MISNVDTMISGIDQVVGELYKKVKSANAEEGSFLDKLSDQLDALDTDGDGNLSTSDLKDAVSEKFPQYSEFLNLSQSDFNNLGKGLSNFSNSIISKSISAYQNSGLSELVSNFYSA